MLNIMSTSIWTRKIFKNLKNIGSIEKQDNISDKNNDMSSKTKKQISKNQISHIRYEPKQKKEESFVITIGILGNTKIIKNVMIDWLKYTLGNAFVKNVLKVSRCV